MVRGEGLSVGTVTCVRVDVNGGVGEPFDAVQELVADGLGQLMRS